MYPTLTESGVHQQTRLQTQDTITFIFCFQHPELGITGTIYQRKYDASQRTQTDHALYSHEYPLSHDYVEYESEEYARKGLELMVKTTSRKAQQIQEQIHKEIEEQWNAA